MLITPLKVTVHAVLEYTSINILFCLFIIADFVQSVEALLLITLEKDVNKTKRYEPNNRLVHIVNSVDLY